MTVAERSRALVTGLLAGALGGLFGVGGGIFMIPLLTGWLGATQHQAHGTSLAVIGFTALAALGVYGPHANVAWATAGLVGLASVFTARYGARLAARTSTLHLKRAFAVLLFAVGLRMLWHPAPGAGALVPEGAIAVGFDLALGACVGLLAGYMGVGGGVLAVPAFTLLLGMPQQLAQGTSLAVILVAAPAGALEHHRLGNVTWRLVGWLAVGAALGSVGASALVQRVPAASLTRAFALFQLVNAATTWWRAGRAKPA